jgi:hypothetical protein
MYNSSGLLEFVDNRLSTGIATSLAGHWFVLQQL